MSLDAILSSLLQLHLAWFQSQALVEEQKSAANVHNKSLIWYRPKEPIWAYRPYILIYNLLCDKPRALFSVVLAEIKQRALLLTCWRFAVDWIAEIVNTVNER